MGTVLPSSTIAMHEGEDVKDVPQEAYQVTIIIRTLMLVLSLSLNQTVTTTYVFHGIVRYNSFMWSRSFCQFLIV